MPDYQQPPAIRVGKSMIFISKAFPPKKDEGNGKEKDPKGEDSKQKKFPPSKQDRSMKGSDEDDETSPKGKDPKGGKALSFDVGDHPEGGDLVSLHNDVDAHLPDDADFQHHASEYAKHHTAYQIHKENEPDRAEAHRHAANLHAKLANAMLAAQQEFRGAAPAEPEQIESIGAGPGGGLDLGGAPLPRNPDNKRNPPGRDSEIESKRRLAQGPGAKQAGPIRKGRDPVMFVPLSRG